MKITVVGRQMNVWEEMKQTVQAKLSKLDKYFSDECTANVTLSSKHNQKCLEITISASGFLFRSEVEDETFRNALDRAVYTIERQIRKNKTRLEKRLREGAFLDGAYGGFDAVEEETEFKIRRKSFDLKPMTAEEAIMQMNLIGHEFFVYEDQETDEINVVYKRKDGAYGLIETHK